MRLGSRGIVHELEKGTIKIDPFNESSLQPNSYDVAIDKLFYSLNMGMEEITGDPEVLVIRHGHRSLERLWVGPHYQKWGGEWVVKIEPHSMVLAATIEVIGAYKEFSTLLKTKSTIARLGIEVCPGAGFGDVGFVNKWTMEIRNNTNRVVIIPYGTKIAQIAFDRIEGQGVIYSGSYLQQKAWEPEQMLPVVKESIMVPLSTRIHNG